jgi:AraC family transcriptional regulator
MTEIAAPRLEEFGPVTIAGLGQRYTQETSPGIPALWQRFVPYLDKIAGQTNGKTYGVETPLGNGTFEYLCGVEVSAALAVPAEFSRTNLPSQKYAVFPHGGYISSIRETWDHIWTVWRPATAAKIAKTPRLEIYSASFNAARPGGVEIWIPIQD